MKDFVLFLKEFASRKNIILTVLISAFGEIVISGIVSKIWKTASEENPENDRNSKNNNQSMITIPKPNRGERIIRLIVLFIVLCVIVFILLAAGEYIIKPPTTPTPIPTIVSHFPSVGETIEFGLFWQTKANNGEWALEPIRWIVLKQSEGKALLLSEKGLTYKPVAEQITGDGSLVWEESDLYRWLTTDFCSDSFFSEEEKKAIVQGNDKTYLISCPSKSEVLGFFQEADDCICKPTEYAASVCENSPPSKSGKKPVPSLNGDYWWLCEPGGYASYMTVSNQGIIKEEGTRYTYYGIMVRPTIWIYLDQFLELQADR